MVLENNKALLYLSSTGFQLYDLDGVASVHFNFPEGTVHNSNVVDPDKLKKEVKSLIEGESPKNSKGGELAVVLAEDTIRQGLIDVIGEAFGEEGWKSEMRSLPLAAQEVEANKTLTPDLVRAILIGEHMAVKTDEDEKDSGVIEVEEDDTEESPPTPVATEDVKERPQPHTEASLLDEVAAEASRGGSGNMKKIILVVLLLLVGGALIFFGIKAAGKFMGGSDGVEVEVELVEETTPAPTATPEATIEKSEVEVSVLNGTGTPGQAGKAKAVMEDLGFEDVTVGNATSKNATVTTVEFSSDIPASLRKEIVDALDEVFDEVEEEVNEDEKMTITVTTGSEQEDEEEAEEDSE